MLKQFLFVTLLLTVATSGCGSSSAPTAAGDSSTASAPVAAQTPWEQPVPKASCGPNDVVEPALQGQVTLMERFAGFSGTHCNLALVGQYQGEGANVTHQVFGHCAYYGQAGSVGVWPASVPGRAGLKHPGVVVLDVSNPGQPVATAYLSSISFLDPWESLKVNAPRQLLAAVNGTGGAGGPQFDVYDLSQDCAHPKLLASVALSDASLKGHEGNWAPDGMTYYGGGTDVNTYYAIDVSDPAAPKLITKWSPSEVIPSTPAVHGLSVSTDGNRGYFAHTGGEQVPSLTTAIPAQNGFDILDLSEIQARKANPQVKVLTTVLWRDGVETQHTIPIFIQGHPYLVATNELGSGGFGSTTNWASACAVNMPPFGFPRIYDISNETQPQLVSKLMLEVDDPANCSDVILDNTGQLLFGYDSHQCAVDDLSQATILVCGQFASGLRVYDIRNPYRPRELAYYNPPAKPGYLPGSGYNLTGLCGTTDWTASMPAINAAAGEILFVSTCNGFQVLKFTNGAWPFAS
jgi:hypothetical protein